MIDGSLSKIEINLPITVKTAKILSQILDWFVYEEGIGGCTYSSPSEPTPFRGKWLRRGPVRREDFKSENLIQKLREEKIIKADKDNADQFYFDDSSEFGLEKRLNRLVKLKQLGEDKERILNIWRNSPHNVISDYIILICACYDVEHAKTDEKELIKYIKDIIKKTGEDLAWITYSSVCFPEM